MDKDFHIYLSADDQKKIEIIRRHLIKLGIGAKIGVQTIIRFALSKAVEAAK